MAYLRDLIVHSSSHGFIIGNLGSYGSKELSKKDAVSVIKKYLKGDKDALGITNNIRPNTLTGDQLVLSSNEFVAGDQLAIAFSVGKSCVIIDCPSDVTKIMNKFLELIEANKPPEITEED